MGATVRRASTAGKIERLRRLMESRGLDAIVVSSYQNVSYFGGSTITTQVTLPDRLGFLIARRDGAATLLFCNIEISQLRTQTDIDDIRDSLSYKLGKVLRFHGADVRYSDEFARDPTFISKEELVAACDVVIVGVPHSAYRTLQVPADVEVIDLWGVLPKAAEV